MGNEEEIIRLRKICNQNKLKVYDAIFNTKYNSFNQLIKNSKVGYKNAYRYLRQLEKEGIISIIKAKSNGRNVNLIFIRKVSQNIGNTQKEEKEK